MSTNKIKDHFDLPNISEEYLFNTHFTPYELEKIAAGPTYEAMKKRHIKPKKKYKFKVLEPKVVEKKAPEEKPTERYLRKPRITKIGKSYEDYLEDSNFKKRVDF
jgi:hypothetical protein